MQFQSCDKKLLIFQTFNQSHIINLQNKMNDIIN